MDVPGNRQVHLGIIRPVDHHGQRRAALPHERARVERGDDRPFLPRLERLFGERGGGAAAACADLRDMHLFFIEVGDLEGKFRLGPARHMPEVVSGRLEHLLRPLPTLGGRQAQTQPDHRPHRVTPHALASPIRRPARGRLASSATRWAAGLRGRAPWQLFFRRQHAAWPASPAPLPRTVFASHGRRTGSGH